MRELKAEEVEFELQVEPDDIPYKGNCSAIDPETDRKREKWIERQLKDGNGWAWCKVLVFARWNGHEGWASLGGCSFNSEKDFRRRGYFEDMKEVALNHLNEQLAHLKADLDTLED